MPLVLVLVLLAALAMPARAGHDDPFKGTVTGLSCDSDAAPTFCTGFLGGLEDVALDVDLALPAKGPYPLIVVIHGWGGSKGGGGASSSYPGDEYFTDRGYAVLRYSARGFGDSWGQTHLASRDVEIVDLQLLVSHVVDDDRFDVTPTKIGVTGASYGGGHSYLIATKNRWTSPGGTRIAVAAVAPIVPWTDLVYSLQPNGTPDDTEHVVGTMKLSYVSGLFAGGARQNPERPYPNYIELLPELFARVLAGEPYQAGGQTDPIIEDARHELGDLRSVSWQDAWFPGLRKSSKNWVPIFEVQGWTDDLFPATEAFRMWRMLKEVSPSYPIKLYLGDIGHPRARNKPAETQALFGMLTKWFDHWLKGLGPKPAMDVTSATTLAGDAYDPALVVRAASPTALSTGKLRVRRSGPFALANQAGQAGGVPADPIVNQYASALADPLAPHLVRTAEAPGGAVQVVKQVDRKIWYLGQGTVRLEGSVGGADVQYDVRVWDRAPDGTVELVDRGTYKFVGIPGALDVSVPLFGNAWIFKVGHQLLVEVTNVDDPFLRPNNLASATELTRITVTLPTRA